MLRNFVNRKPAEYITYHIEFTDETGNSGYSFDADENGNPIFACEAAEKNYNYAINHPEEFPTEYNKFTRRVTHYTENAHGTCICGQEVELYDSYMGACECHNCGRWYNLFGQEILNPKYWEED